MGGGDGDFDDVVFTAAGLTTTEVQLALAPRDGTVAVGSQTCVTGSVTDEGGQPVEAAAIDFEITGANPASASRLTTADGRAELCYIGTAVGTDTITAAVNGIVDTVTRTWTAVVPVNRPPTASAQAVATDRDKPVAITLAGSDLDGDVLTFAVVGQPGHGTLSGSGGLRTYTPAAGYVGADAFTFTVSDGALTSVAATVSIEVRAVNRPPTASAQAVATDRDKPVAITLAGSDLDGDVLTFAVVGQPGHGTLSGSGGLRTYTPAAGYVGADAFTFTVSDGALTSVAATVSIEVRAVNRPPTASAQAVATDRDKPVAITLAGSDLDGDVLTFAVVGQPGHGTLSGSGGLRTYTPAAGYVGADAFTFTVSDGALTSVAATVSITVKAVASPSTHELLVSADPAHLVGVRALDGQTFRRGAPIFAFVGPKATVTSIKKVTFWIDDPQRTGPAFSVENDPGFDLARTADLGWAYPLESSLLSLGTHTVTAKVETKQGMQVVLTATITVADADVHSLRVSTRADRDGAVKLDGTTLKGGRYIFLGAEGDAIAGLDRVVFTLDGKTVRSESDVDYDLAGTTIFGNTNVLDTRQLRSGLHTLVATVQLDGDEVRLVYQARFTVAN